MNPINDALQAVIDQTAANDRGAVADYIPELAKANPENYGLALTSINGRRYRAGDSQQTFTIQSISKPFVYALALSQNGVEEMARHVGYEPSGEPFNAISLEPGTGRPSNPLINAGALVTTSLVQANSPDERFELILQTLSDFAGRPLAVNEAVFQSENKTGDRNRALAYLAKSSGVLVGSVVEATEVYFRQCSILVSAEDLSVMAATLAHGGVNPVTGKRVVSESAACVATSIMLTCGMYDASGSWMVRIGMPAKSGVGGGIIAVLPGTLGVATYSPRLDEHGNSVRGIDALRHLSGEYRLHMMTEPEIKPSTIRRIDREDNRLLVTLQGDIDFIAAEQIVDAIEKIVEDGNVPGQTICVDIGRITRVRPVAKQILQTLESNDQWKSIRFEVKE